MLSDRSRSFRTSRRTAITACTPLVLPGSTPLKRRASLEDTRGRLLVSAVDDSVLPACFGNNNVCIGYSPFIRPDRR